MAYTYLIGWSNHDQYYYGVRYAQNCDPSELWTKYKTSSKYVMEAAQLYGDPDVIQVRKTFDDVDSARVWEHKVLKRMNAVERSDFINRTDNMSIVTDVEYDRIANLAERVEYTRGKTWEDLYTPEQIERRLASAKEAGTKKRGVSTPKKADRSKYKQAANARWQDESKRAAYKSRKHMNKNGQRKFALPNEQQALLSEGWSYGRG